MIEDPIVAEIPGFGTSMRGDSITIWMRCSETFRKSNGIRKETRFVPAQSPERRGKVAMAAPIQETTGYGSEPGIKLVADR